MMTPIKDAVGERLAKAVKNKKGMTILNEGVLLNEALILALEKQGILEVEVDGGDKPDLSEAINRIEEKFEGITDVHMLELKKCLIKHMTEV